MKTGDALILYLSLKYGISICLFQEKQNSCLILWELILFTDFPITKIITCYRGSKEKKEMGNKVALFPPITILFFKTFCTYELSESFTNAFSKIEEKS